MSPFEARQRRRGAWSEAPSWQSLRSGVPALSSADGSRVHPAHDPALADQPHDPAGRPRAGRVRAAPQPLHVRRRIQRCRSRNRNSNRTRSISISISLALTRSLTFIRGLSRTPTLTLTLGATSRFAVLPAVLPPLDAARLLAEASTLAFDTRPDSVDREPAHELYLVRDGAVQPDARSLHEMMKPSVAWLTQPASMVKVPAWHGPSSVPAPPQLLGVRPGRTPAAASQLLELTASKVAPQVHCV